METDSSGRIGRLAIKCLWSVVPITEELEVLLGTISLDFGIDFVMQISNKQQVDNEQFSIQLKGISEKLVPKRNGRMSFYLKDEEYKNWLAKYKNPLALIVVDSITNDSIENSTVYYCSDIANSEGQITVDLDPMSVLKDIQSWKLFIEKMKETRHKLAKTEVTNKDKEYYLTGQYDKIISSNIQLENGYYVEKNGKNWDLKHVNPLEELIIRAKVSVSYEEGDSYDIKLFVKEDSQTITGKKLKKGKEMFFLEGESMELKMKSIETGRYEIFPVTYLVKMQEWGMDERVKSAELSPLKFTLFKNNFSASKINKEKMVELGYEGEVEFTLLTEGREFNFMRINTNTLHLK